MYISEIILEAVACEFREGWERREEKKRVALKRQGKILDLAYVNKEESPRKGLTKGRKWSHFLKQLFHILSLESYLVGTLMFILKGKS